MQIHQNTLQADIRLDNPFSFVTKDHCLPLVVFCVHLQYFSDAVKGRNQGPTSSSRTHSKPRFFKNQLQIRNIVSTGTEYHRLGRQLCKQHSEKLAQDCFFTPGFFLTQKTPGLFFGVVPPGGLRRLGGWGTPRGGANNNNTSIPQPPFSATVWREIAQPQSSGLCLSCPVPQYWPSRHSK